jgi:precorrin-2 dehydrogenase/sirohydrochlorin ferrochelatase
VPVGVPLYPANLIVAGRPCLVVGGGHIGARKAAGLLECEADVTVVAPDIVDALLSEPRVRCERRPYRSGEVAAYRLAVAATGRPEVDGQVFAEGEAHGVWVNAADDPERCSFTLPARVRRGDVLVTVSTGGRSPALASWLRDRLSEEVGPEYADLLDVLATEREQQRASGHSTEALDWESALRAGVLDLVREGRISEAGELLRTCLSSS